MFQGQFQDKALWDGVKKTAISVRDGVLEYYGHELGIEPSNKKFRIYRSPSTIANIIPQMDELPITDGHVDLDRAVESSEGAVQTATSIDLFDSSTKTTLGIKNNLIISDEMAQSLTNGEKELSLGYFADIVDYEGDEGYDFAQANIRPHHLARVPHGRCGSKCSFIDRKPTKENDMFKKQKAKDTSTEAEATFVDADGKPNMQQIAEVLEKLPEAIKTVPVDKLAKIMPMLQGIVAGQGGSTVATEENSSESEGDEDMTDEAKKATEEATTEANKAPEGTPNADAKAEAKEAEVKDSTPIQDSQAFKDAVAAENARFVDACSRATDFLADDYDYKGKTVNQIMTDAVATVHEEKFSDEELPIVFKTMSKPESQHKDFGDANPDADWDAIGNSDL